MNPYLNLDSHHPIEHKLSLVRTLLERNQSLISDDCDKQIQDSYVEDLRSCAYPDCTFQKVRNQMQMKTTKSTGKQKQNSEKRRPVVLPYVEGISERVARDRVMTKHRIPVAMRPVKTLKRLLVHPKGKQEKEEITDCV